SIADSSYGTSANFEVDDLSPAAATAIAFHSTPEAGNNTVGLAVAWTETHPNTNTFGYNLNAAGYTTGTGDADTASPSTKVFTLSSTLDGNDYVSAIKCAHIDDFGNIATSENAAAVYIKPYTPAAPTAANAAGSTVAVTVNKHTSETSGLSYAIYETTTSKYVQASGILGNTAVWQTEASWETITVNGLSQAGNNYSFKTKSRNSSDNATESDFSSSAAAANTSPTLRGKDATANISAQEQTDGTNQVVIEYQVLDNQQSSVAIAAYYKNGAGGSWISIDAYCTGNIGTISAGAANRSIIWDMPTQLGSVSGNNYYIRLVANDGQAANSTVTIETTSAVTLDSSAPSSCAIAINEGSSTNTRNINLTLSAVGAAQMYISGNLSDEASTFQWVSFETSAAVTLTDTNGTKEAAVRFKDTFGNLSATTAASSILDTAAPIVAINLPSNGAYLYGTVEVAGTVNDPTTGVSSTQIKITKLPSTILVDWSELSLSNGNFSYDFVLPTSNDDGTQYQIVVRAADAAGNLSDPEDVIITKLASSPAVSSLSFSPGSYTNTANVALNIVSAGAYQMYIDGDVIDDSNTKEWVAFTAAKDVSLSSGNGSKTVSLKVRNIALTESATTSASIVLDTAVPTVALLSPSQSAEVKSTFTVIGTASDEISGVLSAEIKAINASDSSTLLDWTAMNLSGSGPYSFEKAVSVSAADGTLVTLLVKASDRALNVSNLVQSSVRIDISTPEVNAPEIIGLATLSTSETCYLPTTEVTLAGSGEPGAIISVEAGTLTASSQFVIFAGETITWQTIGTTVVDASSIYSITVSVPSTARYLRVLLSDPAGNIGSGTYLVGYDAQSPTISGVLFDGKSAIAGDYVNPLPEISAALSDDTGINANSIAIKIDGRQVTDGTDTSGRYDSWNATTGKVIYTVKTALSAEVTHSLTLAVSDEAGTPATQYSITGLKVDSGSVKVSGTALAYPTIFNPSTQSTKLTYELTGNSDIVIRIYNISAQLIWQRNFTAGSDGAKTGYNEVTWDGISDFGSAAPNGAYIIHILSPTSGGYKVIGSMKAIVLR
ncbi:MAG: Ig-like domain-containing protein, partial [Candidatus Margulisbacteria bacterium]|nr:Ig-like domain-containing protein [Candidatus Margulisiibacteriota bacterium]